MSRFSQLIDRLLAAGPKQIVELHRVDGVTGSA
jgi:hypothetical protein